MSVEAMLGQFDLAWALTDLHLSALTDADFDWEPGNLVWTMHRDAAGRWTPDWALTEPDPVPVPTIGWLCWHIEYWWSAALDALDGRPPRAPTDLEWSGPAATVAHIRSLHDRWRSTVQTLAAADLVGPSTFPWGADAGRTLADTVWWLNIELAKNGAEIGQLRLLRAAR